MQFKQGDIVLLPFPFTDQQGSKVRPGIVVSNSLVNQISKDVIIIQLTTQNIKDRTLAVEINNNHVSIAFKPPHNSQYAYCKKILVIEGDLIIKRISKVDDIAKMQELLETIKSIFALEI
ncbi:MAG: type II toxin-antitoxin system PemK/MazF family toxin [Mucilaginibacter sp.]|uniref:type II toxin-antitoxin system PemK/MazF family toxin n=1 Tax=Mucilaginibacter sp. TaxID=1882438 RepID=UPI0034E52B46